MCSHHSFLEACTATPQPISLLLLLPIALKTPEEDEEDEQEVTAGLAAASELAWRLQWWW